MAEADHLKEGIVNQKAIIDAIGPYFKAIAAFIAPGAALAIGFVNKESDAGAILSQAEWVIMICTCITSAAAVYAVPNRERSETPEVDVAAEPEVEYDPKYDNGE